MKVVIQRRTSGNYQYVNATKHPEYSTVFYPEGKDQPMSYWGLDTYFDKSKAISTTPNLFQDYMLYNFEGFGFKDMIPLALEFLVTALIIVTMPIWFIPFLLYMAWEEL